MLCGVLSAGFTYAYYQRHFPKWFSSQYRWNDTRFSISMALMGPGSLFLNIKDKDYKYGWLFPGFKNKRPDAKPKDSDDDL